ncbi:MAG: PAS domain-containing protein, partial [Poseidonibacter sp.]|uniref:PAS domain-containing protein n=1 Tax=Poseidonibacter sp. TaxID=2321188 RepID=UPI00359EA5BC
MKDTCISELTATKDLTLLYIENDENSIIPISDTLKKYFKSVIVVKNTQEALEQIDKFNIDVLLLDINNIKVDSSELITKSRQINPNILTIVFSSLNKIDNIIEIMSLDIDSYISNILNKNELSQCLEKIANKYLKIKENYENKNKIFILEQYHNVVNSSIIVSKTDTRGIITYANDNFCNISEYTREELIGKNHNIIRHPDNAKEIYENLWETIGIKKLPWTGVMKNLSKSGKTYYVKSTMKPIFDLSGEVVEYISLRNNLSAIMNDKKHLLNQIESNNLSLLALIQIEDFEILDKFYNMSTIEKIEKLFGYELLSYLPNKDIFDTVYNIGNGMYALLIDFFAYANFVQNVNEYFEQLSNNVKNSRFMIDGIEYDLNIIISYSFGKLNLYEDAKCGLMEAVKKKESIAYSNDLSIKEHIDAKKNLAVMSMVKIALDNYNIVSYFQPIIDNKTKKIAKYESLVRLINEEGEILAPGSFL